jgi:hypothetical protein
MNIVINLEEFITFFMIVMMYKRLIHFKYGNIAAYSLISFHLLFGLTNFFFVQGPFGFNSYTWALSNAFVVAMALFYLYVLIKTSPLNTSLRSVPMFWVNFAFLFNYLTTFFIFIFEQYLVDTFNSNLILTLSIVRFLALIFLSILWYALLMIRSDYRNRVITI